MNPQLRIQVLLEARQARAELARFSSQLGAVVRVLQKHGAQVANQMRADARNQQGIADKAAMAQVQREGRKNKDLLKLQTDARTQQERLRAQQASNAQKLAAQTAAAEQKAAARAEAQKAQAAVTAARATQQAKQREALDAQKLQQQEARAAAQAAAQAEKAALAQAKAEAQVEAARVRAAESQAAAREKAARATMAGSAKAAQQAALDQQALIVAQEKAAQATVATEAAQSKAAVAATRAAIADEELAVAQNKVATSATNAARAEEQLAAAKSRSQNAAFSTAKGQMRFDDFSAARLASQAADGVGAAVAKSGNAFTTAGQKIKDYSAHLMKAGKDMQWMGRILVSNITAPLALIGGLGIKWALDFETAMTKIRKVYGDLSTSEEDVKKDTDLLGRAFMALSNIYGVHVEDVAEIAAVWAQAGATGTQLAKVTRLSVEAMLLGDLDVDQATSGLLTVMQAYKLTSDELRNVMALLNVVENETTVSFGDLLTVLEKSAGVARNAGVTIQELASMTASLVPTAGNAAEAGNALKSIIQRVMAPTKEAAAAFKSFGIDVNSASFASKTFTQRLQTVVDKWKDLDQNTKLNFARDVFGLQQANRGVTLLDDFADAQGNYAKAMAASGDEAANLVQYQKELATLLASSPQAFKILTNRLRNLAIQLGMQLIPYLNFALATFLKWAYAFQKLDPTIKKIVMGFVALLAVLGPLLMIGGLVKIIFAQLLSPVALLMKGLGKLGVSAILTQASFLLLIGVAGGLGYALGGLEGALWGVAAAMTVIALIVGGWPAIIAAAVAVVAALAYTIYKHWDGLSQFFGQLMTGIVNTVNAGLRYLPESFQKAFIAVVQVVASAARAVYSWLSYLNPFARHSPSLVEQVRDGAREISASFATVATNVQGSMGRVAGALRRLGGAIAAARAQSAAMALAETLELTSLAGADPGDVTELVHGIDDMKASYAALGNQIKSQQLVVDAWQDRIDAANDVIDEAQDKLKGLEDVVSSLNDELSASQDRLQDWLSTPVAGTYAFEDALFANQQAQKGLQVQIARLELQLLKAGTSVSEVRDYMEQQAKAAQDAADANDALNDSLSYSGLTADEARDRMGKLAAEIENLRGEQMDLRLMGAGSDVLGAIDQQISLIDASRKELAKHAGNGDPTGPDLKDYAPVVAQIDELQKALDKLSKEGEILDLEKALALEPAQKAIEDTQRIAERSLNEILQGIATETNSIAELTARRDAATQAVKAQEEVIKGLTAARDELQRTYDAEQDALNQLQDAYSGLGDAIQSAEEQLDILRSLGEEIKKAKDAAGGGTTPGDFEVPGGAGGLAPEGGLLDELVAQWEQEAQDALDRLFGELFGPIKQKWNDFKTWLGDQWSSLFDGFDGQGLGDKISGIFDSGFGAKLKAGWDAAWTFLKEDIWGPVAENILPAIDAFITEMMSKLGPLRESLSNLWTGIKEDATEIWNLIGPDVTNAIQNMVTSAGIILAVLASVFGSVWNTVTMIVASAITAITNILGGLITMITGVINVIAGIMQGDWGMIWEGVKQIVSGAVQFLLGLFQGLVGTGLLIISGGFTAIWSAINSLWTSMGLPSMQGAIDWVNNNFVKTFTDLPGKISGAFTSLMNSLGGIFGSLGSRMAGGLNSAIGVINGFIRGVNSVGSRLGININIPTIGTVNAPGNVGFAMPFAQGGQLPASEVGGGFVTNGARAIVGEGSASHPEFVIPTDPKYRKRALGLVSSLVAELGMAKGGQIPAYAGGGILGFIGEAANKVATKIWDSTVASAYSGMGKVGGIGGQLGWGALNELVVQVGNKVINKWLAQWWNDQKNSVLNLVGLGSGPTKQASTIKKGSGNNAMPLAFGGTIPPYVYKFARGAMVKGGRGGVTGQFGEGRHDELVTPLPKGWDFGSSGATYNFTFNGDLSFPNITDAGDADEFISNLEALAGT